MSKEMKAVEHLHIDSLAVPKTFIHKSGSLHIVIYKNISVIACEEKQYG